MHTVIYKPSKGRFRKVSSKKVSGATYTPKILADFAAKKIIEAAEHLVNKNHIRVLDPAVGDGELLSSILELLTKQKNLEIEACGFETDKHAVKVANVRLKKQFPTVNYNIQEGNFLEYVREHYEIGSQADLFRPVRTEAYDMIIANPPYVRTQIMGFNEAQLIAKSFGLSGRFDLYYAFLVAMAKVLKPNGIGGIIVSNRFMTIKSGSSVRQAIQEQCNIIHVWDLGDTKIFEAAVLPAVLLVEGRNGGAGREKGAFTSIYETKDDSETHAINPIEALSKEGVVEVNDGRHFRVRQGRLETSGPPGAVWRLTTETNEVWLNTVKDHTWGIFRDIGKTRVGVKTCADKVFIRSDWSEMSEEDRPELLRRLTTHHIANRYKPMELDKGWQILYPHEVVQGKRQVVDLLRYPRSRAYLLKYQDILEKRKYVIDAGRKWYEIWVPQDPSAWDETKLVFRDIAEEPVFWIDQDHTVVNGDCYWMICDKIRDTDLLWLAAAVGNSSFIKAFYDYRFHNKLYAGRRRFITQYVEQFPLPDPESRIGKDIINKSKEIYGCGTQKAETLALEIDCLVWRAFGLSIEKGRG